MDLETWRKEREVNKTSQPQLREYLAKRKSSQGQSLDDALIDKSASRNVAQNKLAKEVLEAILLAEIKAGKSINQVLEEYNIKTD